MWGGVLHRPPAACMLLMLTCCVATQVWSYHPADTSITSIRDGKNGWSPRSGSGTNNTSNGDNTSGSRSSSTNSTSSGKLNISGSRSSRTSSTSIDEQNSAKPTASRFSSHPCSGRSLTAEAHNLHPESSQLACVASGMCSLSAVRPYVGDITPGECGEGSVGLE